MNNVDRTFLDGTSAMCEMWQGEALLQASRDVLRQAPRGPAAFIATSTEGAALAAVCSALRSDGSMWRRVNLMVPAPDFELRVVFVEPVGMGAAWITAVLNRYPQAKIVFPTASPRYASVAASAAAAA